MRANRSTVLRLVIASSLAIGLVVAGFVTGDNLSGTSTSRSADAYRQSYATTTTNTVARATGDQTRMLPGGGHVHLDGSTDEPGTAPHNDNDPATRNSVSRSAPVTDSETLDPTTPSRARADARAAAAQRAQRPVPLRTVRVDPVQPAVPTSRYNLFNNCYGLQSTVNRRWLSRSATPVFTAGTRAAGTPLYFKPTDLGRYLLYTPTGTYLGNAQGAVGEITDPGPQGNWVVTRAGNAQFRLQLVGSGYLSVDTGGRAAFVPSPGSRTQFTPYERTGCKAFPEVATNVVGRPAAGVTSYQETRGYIDAHTHGMAFEFLGGDVHCGRPWSPWGVTVALVDCPDHIATGGYGAVMEAFLSGKASHDPVGWPTFKDWPAPDSLTHEGTYYKWMERSWRAGQRVLVNLLVENNQLCSLYPLKRNSCDDMASIRLQAKDMRLLERYIDAQHGGPGLGWYRIVTNPDQARRVINAGKMAVVMGIETSVLFNCHLRGSTPSANCTKASIDKQLGEVQRLGVVQMELVNKFDNALAGVAGDAGSTGVLVNAANLLETGSAWRMQTCNPNDPEVHDKDQTLTAGLPDQDALFGAVAEVAGGLPALPLYLSAPHHCNTIGLSSLGAHTIREMARRHMVFDPDHMSVKARKASLDLIDELHYSGVVSSHSWSTPDAYPRIYREKGFITPYAGDSTGFVAKWRRHLTWANPRAYWGFGWGADINGLGAQGNPRAGAATHHPVTYPFTALGGVKVDKQVSGSRVYDINKDGVAHYGLYPDWIEDLRMLAGDAIVKDLQRGPEAYLQMWERAYGIHPNACTNPGYQRWNKAFQALPRGLTTWQVLTRIGQPNRRLAEQFTYCTRTGGATLTFTKGGRLAQVNTY